MRAFSSEKLKVMIAFGLFAAMYRLAPAILVARTRFLLAWDVASVAYLAPLLVAAVGTDAASTRDRALRSAPRPGLSIIAIIGFAVIALAIHKG